ncbi:GTPase [Rothia mucilaginosa]|uniref:GTPase n=1 Tax=Rothia mucilaginosa TaxID=43675 RepID=UPI0026ED4427|nr:GTPase [Rothia mucilaginosa]
MPKRDEATNAEAEKIENDRSIADAEFERKLATVLATDPVERVKRLETMSEQLEKDLDNLS